MVDNKDLDGEPKMMYNIGDVDFGGITPDFDRKEAEPMPADQMQDIDLLNLETTDDLNENNEEGAYVAPDIFGTLDTEIKLDDHAGLMQNREESKSVVNDPEMGMGEMKPIPSNGLGFNLTRPEPEVAKE